jgi:anti-sigma factor ChrR (cupin superfamily)
MQIQGFSLKLDEASLPWRTTRHPGVVWIPLHDEHCQAGPEDAGPERASKGKSPRDSTVLIRMDPGCGYPAHRHLDVEEVLVLRGGYRDDRGEHRAGTYLRYPAGSVHAPVALGDRGRPVGEGNPACVLFAVARGGVENVG